MKRVYALVLTLCLMFLAGCGGGDVSEVVRSIGKCKRFRESQISAAMDLVERQFKAEYDGCKLLNLRYDEDDTIDVADGWAEQYGVEDVIILKSDFYVDDSGRTPTLNPNSTYKNWSWILVKTTFGWDLRDCGYG